MQLTPGKILDKLLVSLGGNPILWICIFIFVAGLGIPLAFVGWSNSGLRQEKRTLEGEIKELKVNYRELEKEVKDERDETAELLVLVDTLKANLVKIKSNIVTIDENDFELDNNDVSEHLRFLSEFLSQADSIGQGHRNGIDTSATVQP